VLHGRTPWPNPPLNLEIPAGTTAVLGESGAGKTTLLDLLVAFAEPTRGHIEAPEKIAWVPQSHGLWLGHTVLEHVTLPGLEASHGRDLLARFHLADQSQLKADALSLGEGSRLAVARALAQNAPVLVMDEPLAHLDAARIPAYWQVVREHVATTGASLVFATHDPAIALAEANHAICLEAGQVVYHGPMADLYHRPASDRLARFLGPTNWLTPDELADWKLAPAEKPVSIRPERLSIRTHASGEAVVVASRFFGTHAETVLTQGSGPCKTFLHRPASALPIGARVRVEEVGRD
jgi:iron(III) transport system ATP-binding protein